MRKKNIVILTASHPYRAAGVVAYDLMQIFRQANFNVLIITNSRLEKSYKNTFSLKEISRFELLFSIFGIIRSKLIKLLVKGSFITNPDYHMNVQIQKESTKILKKIIKKSPSKVDAFIYLFPQNFLNTADLNFLYNKTGSPIFWYMMDMAPMTGGCHYAWECLGYVNQCGKCPGIYSEKPNDITKLLWEKKNKDIASSNIIPVAASEWQYKQLQKSSLFTHKKKYKILIPIDSNLFKPADKVSARKKLGLPTDKKILFFGADSVLDKRKGFSELIESLRLLKVDMDTEESSEIFIAIAGRCKQQSDNKIPFNYIYLGYLNYDLLATAFQAADLFACPSVEDTGPMMINQSVVTGTPVVAFDAGVALDLVINNITGLRVENRNSLEFAKAIKHILFLTIKEAEVMRKNCRELGLNKTSLYGSGRNWIKVLNDEIS